MSVDAKIQDEGDVLAPIGGEDSLEPVPLAFRPNPGYSRDDVDPSCHGKRIGILIVAYNAVSTIAKVLQRIPPEVWANVEEVVIFDDASRDHTYELAMGLKMLSAIEKLTVIKNPNNLGYGGNQKAGYGYFIDKGFDIAVLLHGDGQYAPEILSHLYAPLVQGTAEAVFGSRMMTKYGGPLKGGMPLYKLVGNKILTYFENWALHLDLTEFHSGYRAYSLAALKRVDFTHMTNVFHFDTEIIIKLHHQGFRIIEVPIPTYYGTEICYVDGVRYAQDVFRSVVRYRRTVRSVAKVPEFQEYYVHYPVKESRNSSYQWFTRWAGNGNDILDVGCGEGFFSASLVGQGNRVIGVDALELPAHRAELTGYIRADLNRGLDEPYASELKQSFDRVLLQDILEHLQHPEALLNQCVGFLREGGRLQISVPNVANITVRVALLFGAFNYAQRGILDNTHVRFYTRKSIRKLVAETGLEIIEERASVMPIELALGWSAKNPLMRVANAVLALVTSLLPGLFGYQILLLARVSPPKYQGRAGSP